MKIRQPRESMGIRWRSPGGPWQPVFVWRPIRDIHGRLHWLTHMYRRKKNLMVYPDLGWEYGTAFDALGDH